jgi:threonine dehydratase
MSLDPPTIDRRLPHAGWIRDAATRLEPWIRRTPTLRVRGPGARPAILKLEGLQRSGSFKIRGALNKLMTLGPDARPGVVTASGGNHALGVAWAGQLLGIPVHVYVPARTPEMKRMTLDALGVDLHVVDGGYPDAALVATERAQRDGLAYIHAYDDPEVIAGQGTCIAELLEDAPDVRTVVVAIGGGGLAAGAVLAADGRRVVGVEPFGAPTMHEALRAGGPVELGRIETVAADALGAGVVGDLTFDLCREGLDRVELVDDAAITEARRWLWSHLRVIAENGASVGAAALAQGLLDTDPGPVGIVICGANTDPGSVLTP